MYSQYGVQVFALYSTDGQKHANYHKGYSHEGAKMGLPYYFGYWLLQQLGLYQPVIIGQ